MEHHGGLGGQWVVVALSHTPFKPNLAQACAERDGKLWLKLKEELGTDQTLIASVDGNRSMGN